MTVRSLDSATPWRDYLVTSGRSGKTYRVALRGREPGENYCSCPDFCSNSLGTCKHIFHTLDKIAKRFSVKRLSEPYVRRNLSVRMDYRPPLGVRFNLPQSPPADMLEIIAAAGESNLADPLEAMRRIEALEAAGRSVNIYPDAQRWIGRHLTQRMLADKAAELRRDPANHAMCKSLLKVPLLPYQLDGVAFAAAAGRTVLADDMGLGKTIQAIGVAILLRQWAGISRVLVICPAAGPNAPLSMPATRCSRSAITNKSFAISRRSKRSTGT